MSERRGVRLAGVPVTMIALFVIHSLAQLWLSGEWFVYNTQTKSGSEVR